MTLFLNGYVQAKLYLICDTQGKGRLKTGKPIFRRPFIPLLSKLIHKIIEVVMRFGSCLSLFIDGLTNPPTALQRFENSSKPLRYFQ